MITMIYRKIEKLVVKMAWGLFVVGLGIFGLWLISEWAVAAPAFMGRGDIAEANITFSTAELTGNGVKYVKCAAFMNQGYLLEVSATMTAQGTGTSVDLAVLDKEISAAANPGLNRLMNIVAHAGHEEYQPAVPVPFRSKSSGQVCVLATANGGSIAASVRVAGEVH